MLEVRDLVKIFDGFVAVGGVSLDAPRGSIGAIIGPNGAGKTTLFNLITGHLEPDRGHVKLNGVDVTGVAPHDLCRLGVAARSSGPISSRASPCSRTSRPRSSRTAGAAGTS